MTNKLQQKMGNVMLGLEMLPPPQPDAKLEWDPFLESGWKIARERQLFN